MTADRSEDESRRAALESLIGMPFTSGNRILRLRNGVQIFPAMLEAIGAARRSIEFLTFVYWTGDIAERMAEAFASRARAGLRVRVLLDAIGAASMRSELREEMRAAGVELHLFRPPSLRFWTSWHRTHRKVLVCDGRVGFTGGVGISEEWEGDAREAGEWRETHFRIEGPAVDGLRAAFFSNWMDPAGVDVADLVATPHEAPGKSLVQVVRSTATYCHSDAALVLRACIHSARRSLELTTAYFVPDQAAIDALCDAVARGVRVRVLIPGPHSDFRTVQLASEDVYRPLLAGGVELWNFQPTMLHAKVLTVDGVLACIGSSNFNQRSMSQDDELCLQVLDRELVGVLERDFEEDLARSEQIDLSRWKRRGHFQRAKELAARALRRQL